MSRFCTCIVGHYGPNSATRLTGLLAGAEVFVLGGSLQAETDSEGAFVVRDVPFGRHTARATLHGRIVTQAGEPITRGRVISSSDSTLTADADSRGTFVIDGLRRRTEQLHVRAVGYIPTWIEVVATDSLLDLGDVALNPIPQQLATLLVTAERLTRERREFDERQSTGLGTFLDDEDVASYPKLTPAILYLRVPRSELIHGHLGQPDVFGLKCISLTGAGVCSPRNFVDGYEMRGLTATEAYIMLADAKRVEVYGATFAPPKYADFDGCGAVVIWTR